MAASLVSVEPESAGESLMPNGGLCRFQGWAEVALHPLLAGTRSLLADMSAHGRIERGTEQAPVFDLNELELKQSSARKRDMDEIGAQEARAVTGFVRLLGRSATDSKEKIAHVVERNEKAACKRGPGFIVFVDTEAVVHKE